MSKSNSNQSKSKPKSKGPIVSKRTGRPHLDKGSFMLSENEKLQIMEFCERENMSASMFTRFAVRNALREQNI